MNAASSDHDYDVVIAGGGLVGGSLGVALAQTDMRVALIEAVPPDSAAQPSFDDRTIALSHGSCTILQQLGLWEVLADSVFPVRRIHVSEQGRFGTALIDAEQQGLAQLGHVIQGRSLGHALWSRIEALDAIDVYCPGRVTATELVGARRAVTVAGQQDDRQFSTRLLVVADGARSTLRDALSIGATTDDYDQLAIVANVQVAAGHAADTAYERFTPEGPLALLPGRDGRYTVVFARPTAVAEQLMELADNEFLAVVQGAIGMRLGRLQKLGKRVAYPLALVQTETLAAQRAVMIGNAAHGLHPVAGQGFNLGLRDVASLAEVLVDAQKAADDDFDAGCAELLDSYAAWRAPDQRNVVAFTDGLIRFFGRPGRLLSTGRGLGLALFDLLPAGKRELARQTMGLSGRMTRLARGLDL